jgi:hypothetical protein
MKNKNLLIIGGLIIAAFFFFKKKKTVSILPPPPFMPTFEPITPMLPIKILPPKNIYPNGVYEDMRAVGIDTQYLIKNGKKYGITFDQWQTRGFDAGTPVDQYILDTIPDGGTLDNL